MKRAILLTLSLIAAVVPTFAQDQTAEVKVNLPAGIVTIFNPSIEIGFAKQSAITLDYAGAFAEEDFMNTGYPFLFSMGLLSYRHYLKSGSREGFFACGDMGLILYRMNKNIIPIVASDHGDEYDIGHGYVLGCTLGYKRYVGKRFSLEASISGGYQHSRHEQYSAGGSRQFEFNATAEWTLYKAAINLGYRLWR